MDAVIKGEREKGEGERMEAVIKVEREAVIKRERERERGCTEH